MIVSRITGEPVCPADVADAVELWARQWGRHASIRWHAPIGCFVIHLSRMEDDPVRELVRTGKISEERAAEPVFLHTPNPDGPGYLPLDPGAMGAGGIVEWLDRQNMWGRGEFRSHGEASAAVEESNRRREEEMANGERGRELAWLIRRKALGLPQVPVLKDIN